MNTLKYKVLFRCDAANISGIGTGHLFRCITIARLIKKKYRLKFKDIGFVVQTSKKFKKSISILKSYNFKIIKIKLNNLKINSMNEAKYLVNNPANLLIFDRPKKTTKEFVNKIKNSFKKKIIIDDISDNRKYFDLSLNPLEHKVSKFNNSFIGFNNLILPSIFLKKNNKKKNDKNILIFLGGFDEKQFTKKIVKILNSIPIKLNIFIFNNLKKKINQNISKNKLFFFDTKSYALVLNKANIVINAGGVGLFDSIYFNKKIICTPQYKEQEINAKRKPINKVINLIKISDKNYEKKFCNTFIKIYENNKKQTAVKKLQKKIINEKKLNSTMSLIFKLYEKSKY